MATKGPRRRGERVGDARRTVAGDAAPEPHASEQRPPPRGSAAPRTYRTVLLCFFVSGFAALLFETIWTRQFALVFGTSELAIATVLAAYMAGLAFGAATAARVADRIASPILVYGALELGIAVSALAVPFAIRGATAGAVALFGGGSAPPDASGAPLALYFLACSFLILLVPTALMGATLPLLARASVRRDDDIGPRIGTLYAINTGGAVAGTLAAAFVLVPSFGLAGTLLVGVAANLVVCTIAWSVGRRASATGSARVAPARRERRPAPRTGPDHRTRILPLMLVSGIASFTYEILWTRLLGHVLGGSVYAFAIMLASFLTGLTLGAMLAARLATGPARAARGFALAQLATAALSWIAFRGLDALPATAASVGAGGGAGFARNALVAAMVLVPIATCIGATLPFAIRVLARDDDDAATASGRVVGWNTVGAIAGATGAGFFLIPALGYAGMMGVAIALNLLLAAAGAVWLAPPPRARLVVAALAGLAALVVLPPTIPWTLVGAAPLALGRTPAKPMFFAVGRSATVGLAVEGGVYKMRINGLPEGTILPAGQNQPSVLERWLGALPALARPAARTMLVIGLGAGTALEAVPRTIESIDVIELEPAVIAADRRLRDRRAVDPLADPRVHLHVNDARGALVLTATRYDAIVSQPSHPWTAGAAHLYTREFFALVRDHLAPGGVFVQWIEANFVDEDLLRSLLATLADVFPHVRVYRPVFRSGLLFVGADAPLDVEAAAPRTIAAAPDELAWAGIATAEDVAAALALDDGGARRFAAGAPLTTDDRNLLQSRSPRVIAAPLGSAGADRVLAPFDPLPGLARGLDRVYLVRRLLADQFPARAELIAGRLTDPVEHATARALVRIAGGRPDEGATLLRDALGLAPDAYEARVALLRLVWRDHLANDATTTARLGASAPDPLAAVLEGWRLEALGEWPAIRALEERLGAAAPRDAAYGDALRLRAAWRLAIGDAQARRDALPLIDRLLHVSARGDDRELRGRAFNAAGFHALGPEG